MVVPLPPISHVSGTTVTVSPSCVTVLNTGNKCFCRTSWCCTEADLWSYDKKNCHAIPLFDHFDLNSVRINNESGYSGYSCSCTAFTGTWDYVKLWDLIWQNLQSVLHEKASRPERPEGASCLTPDASALMGNVVLQTGAEGGLSPPAADAPVVHQEESLAVVVQAEGVAGRVLDVVASRKTALKTHSDKRSHLYLQERFKYSTFKPFGWMYRCHNISLKEAELLRDITGK